MILPTCLQHIDSASFNGAEPTSSHTRRASHTSSLSTLFKSDPPLSGRSNLLSVHHKKSDKESVSEFLWYVICYYMGIKEFLPKKANFYEYTWEVVVYMVIICKRRLSPNIWPETPNQDIDIENIIFTIWYKEVMKQIEINP